MLRAALGNRPAQLQTRCQLPPRPRADAAQLLSAAFRGEPCRIFGWAEGSVRVPTERWMRDADESDAVLLNRCIGPTIDIGCGPGRMAHGLALLGVSALGIDVSAEAISQARARGANALLRDVFDALPGEGRWSSALLADGNIGIGGDPVRLLRRAGQVVTGAGVIVVDLAKPGSGLRTRLVELEVAGSRSEPFPWTVVSPEALAELADAAALRVLAVHHHSGRWFAELGKATG